MTCVESTDFRQRHARLEHTSGLMRGDADERWQVETSAAPLRASWAGPGAVDTAGH